MHSIVALDKDIEKGTKEHEENRILDAIALISVLHYVIFRFLQSTTFLQVFSDIYKTITIVSLGIIGTINFIIKAKCLRKKPIIKYGVLVFCISLPFFITAWKNDYKVLAFFPLVALCLYDINPEKVIKSFTITIIFCFFATILCAWTGCIKNITSFDSSVKVSYGFVNTTDFAAYFLFIVLLLWCWKEETCWREEILYFFLVIIMAFASYWLTGSRTTLVCFICFASFVLLRIISKRKRSIKRKRITMKWIPIGVSVSFIILFWALTILYGTGIQFAEKLDSILSNRLSITWNVLQQYGVTLFGNSFEMHGWGGTMVRILPSYDFLDSSYAYLVIRYGLVVACITIGIWILTMRKAVQTGRSKMAIAMTIIGMYGFSESHMLEINYNIFLVMPFCLFKTSTKESRSPVDIRTLILASITSLSILFFPRTISKLRTFFYINGWNNNSGDIKAFVIVIFFMCVIFVFWKIVRMIKRNKSNIALYLILFLCINMGLLPALQINQTIQNEKKIKEASLQEDKEVMQLICEVASQPVYVYEKAEMYDSEYGKFDYLPMSAEDLIRSQSGTIITDSHREIFPLIYNGGGTKYLQFSSSSSIYSYDESVINALSKYGFKWKHFYDSWRELNLSDVAKINDLKTDEFGRLIVNGSEKSVIHTWLFDQLWGTYNYRLKISLENKMLSEEEKDNTIAMFKLLGYKGEIVLFEDAINYSDFDPQGNCIKEYEFYISATPKTEIQVIAEEGIQLKIESISWRKIDQ